MIRRYGAAAVNQAAVQGSASLAKGDVEGLMAWLKVIIVIERLQAPVPANRDAVH